MKIYVTKRQTWPWRMRAGLRSMAELKDGFSHTRPKTSTLNRTTARIRPWMARKPKRFSSLSSQLTGGTVAQASRLQNKTDRKPEGFGNFFRGLEFPPQRTPR